MANFPDHLNIDQAKGLYQAWEKKIQGKEKDALDRLPEPERKAMGEVVDFIQKHQSLLKTGGSGSFGPLTLEDRHVALIKRIGVDLNSLGSTAPPEKQVVIDGFDKLLLRAAAKTLWPDRDNSALHSETFQSFLINNSTGSTLGPRDLVDKFFHSALDQVTNQKAAYRIPGSARSAFFKAVLEELETEKKAGSPLGTEWVQRKVKDLIGTVGRTAFAEGYNDLASTLTLFKEKLGEKLNAATTTEMAKTSVDSRVAKTASILKPLLMRDERLYGAKAHAESYDTFSENKRGLNIALNTIIKPLTNELNDIEESETQIIQQVKKEGLKSLSNLFEHFADPKKPISAEQKAIVEQILTQPNGKEIVALLGHPLLQEVLKNLLKGERASLDNLDYMPTKFKEILAGITKEQWVESSGLLSTNFLKWVAQGRFAPNFLLAPSKRETLGPPGASLRLEVAREFNARKNERNHLVNTMTYELKVEPTSNLIKARPTFEAFAKSVEETRLKYGEVERRYTHNLRGPLFSGLHAEVLFEHSTFLRQEVAMVEALKIFLDEGRRDTVLSKNNPSDLDITIGEAIANKMPVAEILLRLKEAPEVVKILEEADKLQKDAHYWGDASAKKGSFEGAMALARSYFEEVKRGSNPTWDKATFEKAMEFADQAIKNAAQSHLLQFAVAGGWMGAVGYNSTRFQNARLQEARQLKIDIARTAYLAAPDRTSEDAQLALKTALNTAKELGQPLQTRLGAMQKAILNFFGSTPETKLWTPDRSDTSLKGFSDLLLFHGIKEAGGTEVKAIAENIFNVLQAKKDSGKPLSDMDNQHLVLIALILPGLEKGATLISGDIVYMLNRIRDGIKDPNPDLKTMSDSVPILQALSSYYKNRFANFPEERDTITPQFRRVDALLKQIPRAQRAQELMPQYLGQLDQINSNRKEFKEGLAKGVVHEVLKEKIEASDLLLTEILSACRKDPIWGPKALITLLNAGVMQARGPFVELLNERVLKEGVENVAISKDELQALAFMALTNSPWAREILSRLGNRFPAALAFIRDSVGAILSASSGLKGDLSRAEMKKALEMVKKETQSVRESVQDLATTKNDITPIILAAQQDIESLRAKKDSGQISEDEFLDGKKCIEEGERLAIEVGKHGAQQAQQQIANMMEGERILDVMISLIDTLAINEKIFDFHDASEFVDRFKDNNDQLMLIFNIGFSRNDQELLEAAGGALMGSLSEKMASGEPVNLSSSELEFLKRAVFLDQKGGYASVFKEARQLLIAAGVVPPSPPEEEELEDQEEEVEDRRLERQPSSSTSSSSLDLDEDDAAFAQDLDVELAQLAEAQAGPARATEQPPVSRVPPQDGALELDLDGALGLVDLNAFFIQQEIAGPENTEPNPLIPEPPLPVAEPSQPVMMPARGGLMRAMDFLSRVFNAS